MSGEDLTIADGNAAQVEFWNGKAGELWTRNQERLDRAFADFTPILIKRAAPTPTERLIDIGCGELSLALAGRMSPRGHVLGMDISTPMLARARARATLLTGEHASLDWLEADAAKHEFAADFDLLVSRFGVMFFADPAAGFRNLRQALKPGGRFAFLAWAKLDLNPWVGLPLASVRELFGPQPPADPFAPGPFAFADRTRVEDIFHQAGFVDIAAALVEGAVHLGHAEAAAVDRQARAVEDALDVTLRTGPAGALLREADDATKQAARRRIIAALLPYALDGDVKLGGTCWLYTGRNPAND